MNDIISILGIVIGVILLVLGRKKENGKSLKLIGGLLIIVGIGLAVPDFFKGFASGFSAPK
ncbi:hypothetical protein JHL18_24660 [Clostridium sp. YIM B02505]|uniref:Uncharacterized protein n=1 Tax=Clostridium yunnanense TaxID=2800325 RepID=A0ABS1EWX9_9CLOT|nr:hypothetical protein [Clostridium yunnanense]MBK1813815.1 hypothetical protein [Clostridium yunnanense]